MSANGWGYHDYADYAEEPEPPAPRRRWPRLVAVAVAATVAVGAGAYVGSLAFGSHEVPEQRVAGAGSTTAPSVPASDEPTTAPTSDAPATPSPEPTSAAPTPSPRTSTSSKAAAAAAAPQPGGPADWPAANATMEAQVLALVNQERAKAGCQALTSDPRLVVAARLHSQDMAQRNYFAHTTPEGVGFATRITNAGYRWSNAAENIAGGQATPAKVMDSWMHSPGHRANILNCKLRNLGVGLAYNSKRWPLWTQDFGTQR